MAIVAFVIEKPSFIKRAILITITVIAWGFLIFGLVTDTVSKSNYQSTVLEKVSSTLDKADVTLGKVDKTLANTNVSVVSLDSIQQTALDLNVKSREQLVMQQLVTKNSKSILNFADRSDSMKIVHDLTSMEITMSKLTNIGANVMKLGMEISTDSVTGKQKFFRLLEETINLTAQEYNNRFLLENPYIKPIWQHFEISCRELYIRAVGFQPGVLLDRWLKLLELNYVFLTKINCYRSNTDSFFYPFKDASIAAKPEMKALLRSPELEMDPILKAYFIFAPSSK